MRVRIETFKFFYVQHENYRGDRDSNENIQFDCFSIFEPRHRVDLNRHFSATTNPCMISYLHCFHLLTLDFSFSIHHQNMPIQNII